MTTLPYAVLSNLHDAVPDHAPPHAVILAMHSVCYEIEKEYGHNEAIEKVLSTIFIDLHSKRMPYAYCTEWDGIQERHNEGRYSGPTVPLYDIMHELGNALADIRYPLLYDAKQLGVLYPIRKQLLFNHQMYRPAKEGKLLAHEIDAPPEELIRGFLAKTPFHDFFHTRVPFTISKKALSEHFFCCAKQGHGKTVLLSSFVAQFLQDPDQPGLFILDPAGDWFNELKPRIPPERLVVLDPETNPPPLNFFDFRNTTPGEALQAFRYLMSSLTGGLSDKQNNITPYILNLLTKVERPSLRELRKIMDERVKRPQDSKYFYAIEKLEEDERDFFLHQFYNADMNPTKNAISVKIYGAMGSAAFKKMFTADHNSFDARDAMENSKVVLVRGSENTLGEHGLPIFLQYIVSQIFMAALARFRIPEHQRKQCYLICDEAKHIYNHQSERLLSEARKLKISFFSATQMLDQIPTEVKAAVNGNTSVKAAGWLQSSDANMMAREMRGTTGQAIQDLNTFEWIFQVANAAKAVKVTVKRGALERMPILSSAYHNVGTQDRPSATQAIYASQSDSANPLPSSLSQLARTIAEYVWEDPKLRPIIEKAIAEDEAETHEGPSEPEPLRSVPVPGNNARGDIPVTIPEEIPDDPATPAKGRPF